MNSASPAPSSQTSTSSVEQKLAQLGLSLPPSTKPVAAYVPYTICGNQVVISGQLPMKDGKLEGIGKCGKEFSVEEGQHFARLCALNLLAHLKDACGNDFSRVKQCVKLGIFVNSAENFTDQPKVANGASELIVDVFGEAGKHARAAVGVAQLPFGVAVEVDATFEIA
jgi:enamine deaminase RidA (YjgF/YER057c/UK114 family)